MTKKKIISLCLAAVLTVTAVAGASLAYLTDTKDAENTFTVGRVKIDLVEQERSADGTELKDFEQNKKLLPLVGSAQGEKDSFGMPTAKNYVDKMVTVRNTGSEDAYIRLYFAIPSALDDGYETYNAGHNVLHFNFGNTVVNGAAVTTEGTQWLWTRGGKWTTASIIMSTLPTTTRPLPPEPSPSRPSRAYTWIPPSRCRRTAPMPSARSSHWTPAGTGARSPARCSP